MRRQPPRANGWWVANSIPLQQGPDYLTRDLLDSVSNEHPVFVYNASLHLGYCNTVALELAAIDASTPDPQNAEIVRDAAGNPNGVLKPAQPWPSSCATTRN